MIVNPEKFKAVLLTKSKENTAGYPIILRGREIKSEDLVTLLSVTIDYKLSFENQIQELCQRASAQLNALKRLGYFMEPKTVNYGPVLHFSTLQLLSISLVLYHFR